MARLEGRRTGLENKMTSYGEDPFYRIQVPLGYYDLWQCSCARGTCLIIKYSSFAP